MHDRGVNRENPTNSRPRRGCEPSSEIWRTENALVGAGWTTQTMTQGVMGAVMLAEAKSGQIAQNSSRAEAQNGGFPHNSAPALPEASQGNASPQSDSSGENALPGQNRLPQAIRPAIPAQIRLPGTLMP